MGQNITTMLAPHLWSKELDKRVAIWAKNFNSSFKLLLLGPAGAGKTTILKQMKIIHFEGFTLEERQQKAKEIRTNLLESVRELTACITASGHQINWCDKENQNRLDFINGLNLDDQTYDLYAAKIYDYSKRILTDKGVEELFAQLNQLSLTHRSQYLLNRVDEIRNVNYIPNNDDILQSRRRTSDIQKIEFQVKLPVKSGPNIHQTFCMFDVGGQRGERRKWIQVFDGVSAVMFLIDSSSFDAIDEENGRNKLKETLNLFYEVWTTRFLLSSNFVLLFNKQDILKEKIERGHKIEDHFPEYKQYIFLQQDRALLSKAGEKLNLFRSSNRSSRGSTSKLSIGSLSSSTSVGTAGQGGNSSVGFGSLREKRKSSLYKSNTSSHYNPNSNINVTPNTSPIGTTLSSTSTNNNNQSTANTQQNISSSCRSSTITSTAATINNNVTTTTSVNTTVPATSTTNTCTTTTAGAAGECKAQQSSEMAYIKARSFIRDKFLQITRQVDYDQRKFGAQNLMYNSKGCVDQPKRSVCYHYTTATDTENIRDLFENLQKMVIKSTMKDL